jgi:tetratricopeptide (TPR) repeat protein
MSALAGDQQVVFIDSDVPDIQELLAGLAPGVQAFVLAASSDGMPQIADTLAANNRTGLSSISIVGHGEVGALDSGLALTDPDSNGDISSATVAVAGGAFASDGDMLAATTAGTAITAADTAAIETLTLTGVDTLADHQALLRQAPRLGPAGAAAQRPHREPANQPQAARLFLDLAARCWGAGRAEDALMAWRQAVRHDPNNYTALYYLGFARLRAQQVPQAIDLLRRAIAAKPDYAPAHHAMGMALEIQGDDCAAIEALRRAVALSPEVASAHARLGFLLSKLSERQAAIAAFRRAASVEPDTTLGRLALAWALMAEARYDEAEAVLRRSLARDPNNFDTRKTLGEVLLSRGRFDEAASEYQRAITTGGQAAAAYHGLVLTRTLTEADRPLVDSMRKLLEGEAISDFNRMVLHFALGKALDDLAGYAAAMQQFDAANRLRHRTHRLDRAAVLAQFDALIERFTPAFFAEHAGLGDPDASPLLLVGMPRSGTTLTEQIISSHPDVAAGGELPFWPRQGPAWQSAGAQAMTAAFASRVTSQYRTVLREISPDARRITDKTPANFVWVGLIHLLFPNARIIHCKRHPIDTCLSVYATYFSARMDFAADRGDLAFFYEQYLRLMAHWKAVLPPNRLYETQYEALVACREPRSRELVAFCGLEWDDACLAPERNERVVRTASVWQARQPVYRTEMERWRRYEPWLGELRRLVPADTEAVGCLEHSGEGNE